MDYPLQFDSDIYKTLNPDLCNMTEQQLKGHYYNYGVFEGRRASEIFNRNKFFSLINSDLKILEFGPFVTPLFKGSNVRFADVYCKTKLQERASKLGLNPASVPFIDYIIDPSKPIVIDDNFDYVVSSHLIEHQPDLVQHLKSVENILEKKNGEYFLAVPDKRYCFDSVFVESNLSDVLEAYCEKRMFHSFLSIINSYGFATHNNTESHWCAGETPGKEVDYNRITAAIKKATESVNTYLDVHAWYFTPSTFHSIITQLNKLELTKLVVKRLYPTLRGNNEFWVILGFDK